MANYTNKLGDIFTQEEIDAAALENGVDVDKILADNELSLEGEKPGKSQGVTVKKQTVAPTKTKSVSSSKNTSSASSGNKKYPWDPANKSSIKGDQLANFKTGEETKKAAEKAQAKKAAEKKEEEKRKKEEDKQFEIFGQLVQVITAGADPNSVEGSFGNAAFKEAKKKEAEKAKQLEEEKIAFEARMSRLALKNNDEAKKWYEDAKTAAKVTDEEVLGLDKFINLEIAKNNTVQQVTNTGGDNYGLMAKESPTALGLNAVKEKYQAFPEQVKKIKAQLKSENLLNKFSEDEILQQAAKLWKAENIKKIQESKFRDALEDTTNISETAKEIVNNYTVKTKGKEELDYVKNTIFKDGIEKSIEKNINDINKINEKLKPKGYKFQTQDEINIENDLITKRNTLIKDLDDLSELRNETSKKIVASSKNIDDLNLQSDMFSRDYSWSGVGQKIVTNFKMAANDLLGFASYTYKPTEMVYDALNIKEITGIENPFTAINTALAENKERYEEELTYNYAKPREGGIEANFEKVGDLLITQAPNIALMILTRGGSAGEQVVASTSKSLLAKTGKFAKDYLTLNRQTASMAAVATGSKYLDMVNEERNGYYTEDGVFVKPNYNAMQLIVAPAAFGYVEGVFEKSTGKILEKGKGFFINVAKKEPGKWFDFEVATGKKFAKQAGINLGEAYAEEVPSEVLTTVGHNILDKFVLGKEVNLLDNTEATIKDAGTLTTVLAGAPLIGGAIIRPFMSKTTAQKLSDNARGLAAILHELEFNKDLSNVQQEALVKRESILKAESTTLLEKTISDIDAMPIDTFNSINKSVSKMADFINKANAINESDSKSKETDLEVLKRNYVIEQTKLNTLTNGIENIRTFGQPLSPISRAQLIDLNSKRVEASFNPDLNEDEKKTMLKKIELQTKNIYKKEGIDLGEVREKEFQENLDAAKKLGESANVEVILANNLTEARTKLKGLVQQKLVTAEEANISGFKGADGGIITNDKTGKSYIVINKRQAIKQKAVSVGSHEFLHKLMEKTLSNVDTQIELGKQLRNYLLSSNPELYLNEKVLIRLEGNYGDKSERIKNEELLTIFSDALLTGNVKYNESFFTKLGDTIRRYLQDLGLIDITFDSGRDVFNFIRDYNASIQKGGTDNKAIKKLFTSAAKGKLVSETKKGPISPAFSKSIEERMEKLDLQLSNNEIDWDKYESEMEKLEQEEFEESKRTYEEEKKVIKKEVTKKDTTQKEPTEISEAAAKAKAKLDAIGNDPKGFNPNNPAIYDELDKMVKVKSRNYRTSNGTIIDLTNKNKGGLDGFSMEEMTSYVTTSMLPYIQKFDPSKNDSLYGYINAQLANRMKAALKSGQVADVVFTEDVTEMTKLSNEEVEVKSISLPERKRFQNILESGVFSPDVIENVQAKILPILRTLKSKINEKTTLNKTTAPIINEIRTEIGKQADIDIKKAMGGKEDQVLQNFLITNKKTILENLTTTWLMGKDNGKTVSGGMPFAIQKRVNGKWLNYPDWIGKKIDREAVTTDLAGRTSGTELARRLPEVNKNISTEEFLSAIIDLKNGDVLRGRKESLAKALSEELAFDLISDDMANEGPLYKALEKNQEILGAELEKLTVQNFDRLVERGNIKFSKSKELYLALKENNYSIAFTIKNNPKFKIWWESQDDPYQTRFKANLKSILYKLEEIKTTALSKLHEAKIKSYFQTDFRKNNLPYSTNRKSGKGSIVDIIINKKGDSNIGTNIEIKLDETAKLTSFVFNEKFEKLFPDITQDIINNIKNNKNKLYNLYKGVLDFDALLKTSGTSAVIKLTNDQYNEFKQITNFIEEGLIEGEGAGKNKYTVSSIDVDLEFFEKIASKKEYPVDFFIIGDQAFNFLSKKQEPNVIKNLYSVLNNIDNPIIINTQILRLDNNKITLRNYVNFTKEARIKIKEASKDSNIESSIKAIIKELNSTFELKSLLANSISLENNISQSKLSKSISTVSDFINANNLKRIDAETSFDVLNDLNKEIENYWGIVPNDVIVKMGRAVDYAFDVIEDRENEGGPLMAAVNDALNLETIKFAEKQLNEFVENNRPKDIMYSKSSNDYTTVYAGAPEGKNLKEIGRKGVNFFATDKREADEYARMNDGITQEFVIKKNDIVNEDIVFDKIKELGLEPISNKYTVDEQMLYELIDPRFEGALSSNDITTLFNALRKDGIKAISYTDGAQVTGNTTKSIAVIDTSVLDNQTNTKFSKTLDFEFNDILERNTGVAAFTKVSDVVAKRTGIKKNKLSFFVPPSADDFRGLTTYMFAGKGKQGEQDQEFFDKNLVVPYVKGINTLDSVRQSIRKEYKMLLNNFPDIKKKLEKLTPDKGFTYDQAVRVYLWSSTGKDIPGLSRTDKNKLLYFVKQNPDLLAFANSLSITGRQDGGWIDPSTTWDSETIISDLHNITEGAGRKKYLEEFIENADAIFTKENLNKIQSIYGTNTREALEDSLYRMKNGKNRPEGTDRVTNVWMNWINGSTAAIMFFNTRSALLQTISAMNFLNWNDNNPYKAGKAFLNQKQYWTDFAMIINSDKLKERRSGLKADVTQAEIANAANSAKNKFNGVISYLQKIGFTPTQAADSFSIAISGATFYRNRVNTYLKAGNTQQEAEEKAFNDFSIITDQSMQSADPMYVSKQQTTALGRIILAFGNTPMQYNRLIKKATLDLVNRRGDWRTNVSKIVYYGALQNILFSALQSALFIPLGYDDEEEPDTSKMTKEELKEYEKLKKKQEDKITNMINGMADTLLRGSGVYGAAIATIKNTIMEYFKQEEKEMFADHAYTVLALTSVSPPISSKARKLYGAIRISKFEKDVIAERGWEVTRDGKLNLAPNYRILGNVTVATTNLPLDRIVEKVNNISEVIDSRNSKTQRAALALGWKDWELNVKNEENEIIKETAKEKRKEEGIEKAIETRAENKRIEEEKYEAMSVGEKAAYRKKIKEEKRRKKLLRRKRKMG